MQPTISQTGSQPSYVAVLPPKCTRTVLQQGVSRNKANTLVLISVLFNFGSHRDFKSSPLHPLKIRLTKRHYLFLHYIPAPLYVFPPELFFTITALCNSNSRGD